MPKVKSNCKHLRDEDVPENFGSSPECAFDSKGMFKERNWNCALLDPLREAGLEREVWNEDNHCAVVGYGEVRDSLLDKLGYGVGDSVVEDYPQYAVLLYYKHRGETRNFWVITNNYRIRQGTERDAELFKLISEEKK